MVEVKDERRKGRKKATMATGMDRKAGITSSPTLNSRTQSSFGNQDGLQCNSEKTRMRKCYSDSTNRYIPDEKPPAAAKPTDKHKKRSRPNRSKLFSPKDINACILSSENARLQCSVIIALVVVMSCISVPHGMTKSNSVIASRPLYILILTDVTIVVARLLIMGKQEEPDTAAADSHNEDGEYNWKEAFAVLEIGLVLYQTIRALFIDCSFYLVVVLCGLSLL